MHIGYNAAKNKWIWHAAILGLIAILMIAAGTQSAKGMTPVGFMQGFSAKTQELINNKEVPEQDKVTEIKRVFTKDFDLKTVARLVLGKNWHAATAEEKKQYTRAFERFVAGKYARTLSRQKNVSFKILSGQARGKHDAMVDSLIHADGRELSISWRLRKTDDSWNIIDVVTEGVSMVVTHRQEFANIISLNGGNLKALIDHLSNKYSDNAI